MMFLSHHRRWAPGLAGLVLAVALAIGAAPAGAAQGHYAVSQQSGVAFPLLTSRNLVTSPTDDGLFRVATFMSGINKMPFNVTVYGTTYSSMTISSNGNIQLGVCCSGGSTVYSNTALPSGAFANRTLSVFWDDLNFNPADTGHFFDEGIFTKITGTAPHRSYIVSWQGHSYNSESYTALAQAVFTEGSQTIKYRYGARDNQAAGVPSETIGLQGQGGTSAPSTQVAFNPPPPGVVVAGRQFTFTHLN
jgi:hypothetical protein